MRSAVTVQWHKINKARGRNAAGFCFGGGLGRVERVEGRNKLGDPAKPLILLAIVGSVPKIYIGYRGVCPQNTSRDLSWSGGFPLKVGS